MKAYAARVQIQMVICSEVNTVLDVLERVCAGALQSSAKTRGGQRQEPMICSKRRLQNQELARSRSRKHRAQARKPQVEAQLATSTKPAA